MEGGLAGLSQAGIVGPQAGGGQQAGFIRQDRKGLAVLPGNFLVNVPFLQGFGSAARQAELIRHIRDHLLTNREGYTSLSRLAAEHEMSVSHLQKLFKQIYGVPVYHYIKEYRLEQAAVELVRSARPVTEIAQDAGYDNASKFSACFKERYGVTPSQYRTDAKAKQSIGTKTE